MKKLILLSLILVSLLAGCKEKAVSTEIRPGNEPFILEGGKEVCVLLAHGFTASPWEVRELAEYLNSKGLTVYGVLLAGHGTSKEHMAATRWEDWYKSVEDGYLELSGSCDKIFVGGISTGGSLSIYLSTKHDTSGIISLASIIYPRNDKAGYASIVKYFKRFFKNRIEEDEKPFYYSERPTASIAELMQFTNILKKEIGKASAPIVIMQYNNDSTADPKSSEYIYKNIGSGKKELVWFDGSKHVLTTGDDKEQVFERVYSFITENS